MSRTVKQIGWTTLVSLALFIHTTQAADFRLWGKKAQVQFTGYSRPDTLTNFPALVVLSTNITGFSYADFVSGTNADLRFADSTETNELNYEVESWNTNGSSYVWVQVPLLAGSNTSIWAYWSKAGQTLPTYATNGVTWSASFRGGARPRGRRLTM